jgi:hypothetical protein
MTGQSTAAAQEFDTCGICLQQTGKALFFSLAHLAVPYGASVYTITDGKGRRGDRSIDPNTLNLEDMIQINTAWYM